MEGHGRVKSLIVNKLMLKDQFEKTCRVRALLRALGLAF